MLRALGTKIPPLVKRFEELCLGNLYTTTLHVLCAAILKLGKVSKCEMVYRAPGGALPASFWCKSPEGVQGGLELAFMSTTTAKKEAMAYARRAPGIRLRVAHAHARHGAEVAKEVGNITLSHAVGDVQQLQHARQAARPAAATIAALRARSRARRRAVR